MLINNKKTLRHFGIDAGKHYHEIIAFLKDFLRCKIIAENDCDHVDDYQNVIQTCKLELPDGNVIEISNNHPYRCHFAINARNCAHKVQWLKKYPLFVEIVDERD